MTTFTETTLPALIFNVPAGHPKGDVPALGRLTVNELQNVDQSWLIWGCETNDAYDITAATAALFYQAEARTLLTGSTSVVLAGVYSGVNAVESGTLPAFDVPIWSTQASGGGAHLTHIGTFRVFARVARTPTPATGTLTLRLDWTVGDFSKYTSNASVTLDATAVGFELCDLGFVTVPRPTTGASRWEGRIVANMSPGGEKLWIDYIFLVPVDVASGEASINTQAPAPSTPVAYDTFDQTAGALVGKTTSVGAAVWTFLTGDTDDWNVDSTYHYAVRTAASPDSSRRVITAGTSTYTAVTGQVDLFYPANVNGGLTLRLVDNTKSLRVALSTDYTPPRLLVTYMVAGADIIIQYVDVPYVINTWNTLTADVTTAGRLRVWLNSRGALLGSPIVDQTLAVFATGGTLESGKVGLLEFNTSAGTAPRFYDNFAIFTPSATLDAVMFANQSAEVRYDVMQREDSTGSFWQPVSSYEGDLLRVPVTGREGRLVRFIVKASRSVPGAGADGGIDDISATLAYQPRYLSVPAAT